MNTKIVVNGCSVVKDGSFKNNNQISEVVISDGIISIGNQAFAGCEKLKKIFVPDSIKHIAASAFDGSGVMLKIPSKNKNEYVLYRTIMIYCRENSYANMWFKSKKIGYIVVNSLNT